MYERGQGALRDNVLAHMWYNVAGSNGDKMGAKYRAIIEKRMIASQIAEAKKLARECVKKNYRNCGK
jgi:uncharacterized protein